MMTPVPLASRTVTLQYVRVCVLEGGLSVRNVILFLGVRLIGQNHKGSAVPGGGAYV